MPRKSEPGPRSGRMAAFRLPAEMHLLMDAVAHDNGETVSDYLRRLVDADLERLSPSERQRVLVAYQAHLRGQASSTDRSLSALAAKYAQDGAAPTVPAERAPGRRSQPRRSARGSVG